MGNETHPIVVMLYSDETQLTGFGNNTLWPVYLWLGNLPIRLRSSLHKGGATLIGYLPKVVIIALISPPLTIF
jgi:hypothetical protein